jgi:hypothetical protein
MLSPCARARNGHCAAEQRDKLAAAAHVWMAPAWQEVTSRTAQKSLAVMCPACSRSPDGLLALMDLGEQTLNTKGAGFHGCWSSRAPRLSCCHQPGRRSRVGYGKNVVPSASLPPPSGATSVVHVIPRGKRCIESWGLRPS